MNADAPSFRISLRELSEISTIPLRTIQRWCDDGKLRSHKLFGRWYLDVHELLSSAVLSPLATDVVKRRLLLKARARRRRLDTEREANRKRRLERPDYRLWLSARTRAAKAGIQFALRQEDIQIPTTCPVLGIPIVIGGECKDNSPSLDRVDNSKGYTRENVAVISWRANSLKKDGSAEEHERIANWMRAKGPGFEPDAPNAPAADA
jgi:hypothetical protein